MNLRESMFAVYELLKASSASSWPFFISIYVAYIKL